MLARISKFVGNLIGKHDYYFTEMIHGPHDDMTAVYRCERCGNCYQYDYGTGKTYQVVANKRCFVP